MTGVCLFAVGMVYVVLLIGTWQEERADIRRHERDAALAALADLREAARPRSACIGLLTLGGTAEWSGHREACPVCRADAQLAAAIDATATPSEHGARVLREAEERGARWALTDEHWGMGPDEPLRVAADVCRAARERGER